MERAPVDGLELEYELRGGRRPRRADPLGVGAAWAEPLMKEPALADRHQLLLRGAALASRRIRLATRAPLRTLWDTIGWCGKPPKDSTRTFVLVSVGLTLGCWILVPILVGLALAT